jgi:SSS family solute:Na+ symporter
LFLADREATWPLVGASMFSANISSQQFVGQAGLAYTIGIAAGAFQLVGALCFTLLGVFFVDVYLALGLRTAPEFFERRYNTGTRMFVSAINVVRIVAANIVAALYAGATVMTSLLGWDGPGDFELAVILIAAAAGAYTIFGGLRSVLWTDIIQVTLLLTAGAIMLCISVARAGGVAEVLSLQHNSGDSMWSLVRPWDHAFGWLPLATGAVILAVHGHCTDHDYVQRALAARSVYHAKMGALFAALLKMIALFVIAAPGVIAAKLMPGLAHPDQAFGHLVTEFVPRGMAGVVLAGLLAAILGTVAAALSASAALLSYDFALKAMPGLPETSRVRLGRGLMGALLIVCVLLAPRLRGFQGLFDYMVRIWALLGPPVFVCVVAGMFTRRATSRGALATLVAGAALGAPTFAILGSPELAAEWPRYLRAPLNCAFVVTVVCAVVMAGFSKSGSAAPFRGVSPRGSAPAGRAAMTDRERRVYRAALIAIAVIWGSIIVTFSPWGIGRATAMEPAAKSRAAAEPRAGGRFG